MNSILVISHSDDTASGYDAAINTTTKCTPLSASSMYHILFYPMSKSSTFTQCLFPNQ